ncbi:hypothetical protein ACLMJK_002995 [Lecanora helva]
MFRWLNGPGKVFRQPLAGSTNYLNAYDRSGNLIRARNAKVRKRKPDEEKKDRDEEKEEDAEGEQESSEDRSTPLMAANKESAPGIPKEGIEDLMPFPLNRSFRSQSVLSEELKDAIWNRVMEEGKSVRDVSAVLGVEINRVAAVVRLKAVEKDWEKRGKPLAMPYAKAVQKMLPQTPYIPHDPVIHESINDLPVHRATTLQVFHPVSESRQFTRRDAGKVFDRNLLPAEDRIPHPELVQMKKWRSEGLPREERLAKQREANDAEQARRNEMDRIQKAREAREVTKAVTKRSVFKFQDIKVERVGRDGRDPKGVGARYGFPHEDRKKGQIKIPTRVE